MCVYNIERLVSHTSSYQLSNRSGRINTELGTHLAGGHGSSRRGARGQGGGCHALGGRGRSSADQSCYSSSASPRRAPRIGFHLLIRCFPHSIPTHPSPSLSYPLPLLPLSSPLPSPSLPYLSLSFLFSLFFSSSLSPSDPLLTHTHDWLYESSDFFHQNRCIACVCVRACVRACVCVAACV